VKPAIGDSCRSRIAQLDPTTLQEEVEVIAADAHHPTHSIADQLAAVDEAVHGPGRHPDLLRGLAG
jgi:hypothetical protein